MHRASAILALRSITKVGLFSGFFFLALVTFESPPFTWQTGNGIALADDGDSDGDSDSDSDSDGDSDNGGGTGGGGGGGGSGGGGSSGGGGGSASGGEGGGEGIFRNRNRRGPSARGIRRSIMRVFRRDRPKRQRTRRARRSAAPVTLAQRASNEIVALGLSDDQIDQLVTQGYVVLQRDTIQALAGTIVRFQVPSGTTLDDARAAVGALNPQAVTDFNHYYRAGSEGSRLAQNEPVECNGLHCASPELIRWPVNPGSGGTCGAGAAIGLIDTGINPEHETFSGGSLEVLTVADKKQRESSRQHGTAVAAILLGSAESRSPGLLPDASIIAVDAFYRAAGNDERSDAYTIVKAMDLLLQRNVAVINMSLAGPANELLERMVGQLGTDNVIVVAAAGNAGPRAKPAYPAAYPNVIAVTAVDRGKRIFRRAVRGEHIDFAAPGVNVWTAASIRGARNKTGTSFAAPFVTAAVALVLAGEGVEGHDGVVQALAKDALDLGEPGKDPIFGHGLLQANGLCEGAQVSDSAS